MENAVLLAVKLRDSTKVERYILQLKMYYADAGLAESGQRYEIMGLWLLHLLVESRLAEFHSEVRGEAAAHAISCAAVHRTRHAAASASRRRSTSHPVRAPPPPRSRGSQIELLPEAGRAHPCITFSVRLEQELMEGAYNRVLSAQRAVPNAYYARFMESLVETVRKEVLDCVEKAYGSLTLAELQKMLLFDAPKTAALIAELKPSWVVSPSGSVAFAQAQKATAPLPSLRLINETLRYATDLDRII